MPASSPIRTQTPKVSPYLGAALSVARFLDIHGYRVAGHTDDPLQFNPVIRSIELKPTQSAVLFAHDGDPVYVMGVDGR